MMTEDDPKKLQDSCFVALDDYCQTNLNHFPPSEEDRQKLAGWLECTYQKAVRRLNSTEIELCDLWIQSREQRAFLLG